jgi:hypothetical protein
MSSGISSTAAPVATKCRCASTCVAVCDPNETREIVELPPVATDFTVAISIGVFSGYTTPPDSIGSEMSWSFAMHFPSEVVAKLAWTRAGLAPSPLFSVSRVARARSGT